MTAQKLLRNLVRSLMIVGHMLASKTNLNMNRGEQKEWIDGELEWWGKYQLKIVAIMALVQVGMFGFMLLSFYTIGELVK